MTDLYLSLVTNVTATKDGAYSKLPPFDKARVSASIADDLRRADENPSLRVEIDTLRKTGLAAQISALPADTRAKLHYITDVQEESGPTGASSILPGLKKFVKDGKLDTASIDKEFIKEVKSMKDLDADAVSRENKAVRVESAVTVRDAQYAKQKAAFDAAKGPSSP